MNFHLNQAPATPNTALTGKGIVITRPEMQAGPMAVKLAELGARPIIFPAVAIKPLAEQAPIALKIAQLADYQHVIFASANAVIYSLNHLQYPWPERTHAYAVGPGTAETLKQFGVDLVLYPASRFDSEGLLDMPPLQNVQGQKILLVRGQAGRQALLTTLQARGAQVDTLECYSRALPESGCDGLLEAFAEHRVDAVLITSSEGAENLFKLLPKHGQTQLQSTRIFAPHAHVAETLHRLGCTQVTTTAGGEDGLLDGLLNYWKTP